MKNLLRIGLILLGIWLIVIAAVPLLSITFLPGFVHNIVLPIIAIISGVLIIIGKA